MYSLSLGICIEKGNILQKQFWSTKEMRIKSFLGSKTKVFSEGKEKELPEIKVKTNELYKLSFLIGKRKRAMNG